MNYSTNCPESEMLAVCLDEQLMLTCQTTMDRRLSWDIYIPHHDRSYSKLYAYEGARDTSSVEVDAMVTLTFDRTSESEVFPLISQLSVNNVTIHLNGTMINCTERTLRNIILQKTIHIIDTGEYILIICTWQLHVQVI